MKRAALVSAGTLAGIAALVAFNPEAGASSPASSAVSSGTTDASSSTAATPTASSTGTSTSGTYTGALVDVGHGYGSIQVVVTVADGTVTAVTTTAVPENDPRSSQISQQAVPMLVDQAISAQSSAISGVSGATFTSNGFAQSLASALAQAGLS
jgi:uncharacterized protein with FMN-binding domain